MPKGQGSSESIICHEPQRVSYQDKTLQVSLVLEGVLIYTIYFAPVKFDKKTVLFELVNSTSNECGINPNTVCNMALWVPQNINEKYMFFREYKSGIDHFYYL